jgi:hypothetical protein
MGLPPRHEGRGLTPCLMNNYRDIRRKEFRLLLTKGYRSFRQEEGSYGSV